jgi:heat shock protein HslJ
MEKTKLGTVGSLMLSTVILASVCTSAPAQSNSSSGKGLSGTKWTLVELERKPVEDDSYNLAFKQAEQFGTGETMGSVLASDWCKDYTGSYEVDHHSLNIHLALSAAVACRVGDGMPFIQTLSHVTAFRIHNGRLELLSRDGAVVARFTSKQS